MYEFNLLRALYSAYLTNRQIADEFRGSLDRNDWEVLNRNTTNAHALWLKHGGSK